MCFLKLNISRGRAVAARVAHNHKVAGSSPAPATKKNGSPKGGPFFLVMKLGSVLRRLQRSQVKNASGILQENFSGSNLFDA